MKPITVLLSIYGNSPFLVEFLHSLRDQSCQEFQLLYRADGDFAMTEDQHRLIPEISELPDRTHHGVVGSYSKLLAEAPDNSYYMFADQDDIWHPDKIEKTFAAMKKAEEQWGRATPILVHSDLTVVREDLSKISDSLVRYQSFSTQKKDLKHLLIQNNVTGCTVMFNKALRDLTFVPSEAVCHDWYLGLVAAAFGKIVFVDASLVDYRQHTSNVYGAVPRKVFVEKFFQRKRLHKRLRLNQKQAAAFVEQYREKLSQEQIAMLKAWANNLNEPNYLKKVACAWRWGFRKNDWLRTIGMWWAL